MQAALILARMGPGGSGLPGTLGACALASTMDVNRNTVGKKIGGKTRFNKLGSPRHSRLPEPIRVASPSGAKNMVAGDAGALAVLRWSDEHLDGPAARGVPALHCEHSFGRAGRPALHSTTRSHTGPITFDTFLLAAPAGRLKEKAIPLCVEQAV